MELNVTEFVRHCLDVGHWTFSDSIANSGCENIGEITWRNACAHAEENPITSDVDALRDHFREYGAWYADELAAMSVAELNALLMQFIAADLNESEAYDTFAEYSENAGGRLYPGDIDYTVDAFDPEDYSGDWCYYLGC